MNNEPEPNNAEAYYKRGNSYYSQEKYEEAINEYSKAIELEPDFAEAYNNRGNAYASLKKHEEAIADYSKAIELKPDHAKAYNNRGNAYNSLKKHEEAIADFNKAIELKLYHATVYNNRGNAYNSLEKYEEAITDYSKAIELKPDFTTAYYKRGDAYNSLEKYEKAIADYSKAIELRPDNSEAYNNRGNFYASLEKYEEATADFNKAIELKPNNSDAYLNMGILFFIIEKFKDSNKAFSQYLKLNNNISPSSKKFIYHIMGKNSLHAAEDEKGTKYFYKANSDPIEILASCKNIEQMRNVTSSLINKNQGCRFNRIIDPIKDNKDLVTSYKEIYLSILKIIYSLILKENQESSFAHYTTRQIASQLILKESPFRLNSASTTNDPTEGKVLMKYLGIDNINNSIDISDPEKLHDFQAFIGCFSFNEKSLNQFRLYGKENSEEATGISIVLNSNFFNSDMCLDILPEKPKVQNEIIINNKYPIFRCLYIDPEKGKVVSLSHSDNDIEIIENQKIEEFLDEIKGMLNKIEKKDKGIIEDLFLTLRYLVKHAAFKEEQECRMICIKDMDEDAKKKREKQEIHFTPDYSRMYVNYQKIDKTCLEKVIFGPKAKGFEIFKKALKHEDIKCECEKSELPFA